MSTRQLNEPWTAYVVSRMHRCRIPLRVLAQECFYSASYLSNVLNGNKKFKSADTYEYTKNRILSTAERLVEEVMRECGEA